MFSFSFWTLVESVSIWLTSNIDIFIIGRILDNHYLGLYKTTITTISTYVGIIAAAITTVLFSTLSRYQNDKEKFLDTYFRFQRKLGIILIPLGLGIFVFRDLVTIVLLGNQWMEISLFLGLYAVLNVYAVEICYFASEVFRSKGQPQVSFIYQIVFISILSPVIYIFAKKSFYAVCIARCACYIPLILIALLFCQVLYGIDIINVIKNILPQTLSALIMGTTGLILMSWSDRILFQVLYIVVCIVLYFFVLLRYKSMRVEVMETFGFSKIFGRLRRKADTRR